MTITYQQITENEIQYLDTSGGKNRRGPLVKNADTGDWEKLNGDVVDLTGETVTWLTQGEIDAQTTQVTVEAFKAERLANIQSLTVTTTAGNEYQADRDSIAAMTARVIALTGELDSYTLKWSLAPTGTGVMDDVTLGDLREALLLATEQITTYWDINA